MDQHVESLQRQVFEFAQVAALTQHAGWKYLVQHIEDVKKAVQHGLIAAKNEAEMVRLQERYKAFESVLEDVSSFTQLFEKAQQELAEIESQRT